MLQRLKQGWRGIRAGKPGQRFKQRYERAKQSHRGKKGAGYYILPIIATLLMVAGIVFCLIPGPGLPLLILGLGLLAERSRTIAVAMDWSEIQARKIMKFGLKWWRQAHFLARAAVIVLAASATIGSAYGAYHFLYGR